MMRHDPYFETAMEHVDAAEEFIEKGSTLKAQVHAQLSTTFMLVACRNALDEIAERLNG